MVEIKAACRGTQTPECLVDAYRRPLSALHSDDSTAHTSEEEEKRRNEKSKAKSNSLKTTTESRIQNSDAERESLNPFCCVLFTLFLLPNLRDAALPKHLPCWKKQTLLQTDQRFLVRAEPKSGPDNLFCSRLWIRPQYAQSGWEGRDISKKNKKTLQKTVRSPTNIHMLKLNINMCTSNLLKKHTWYRILGKTKQTNYDKLS